MLAVGYLAGPCAGNALEDDERDVGFGHASHLVGDEREDVLLVFALEKGGRDGARGSDPLRPDHGLGEQPRILDRDACRSRQHHDRFAVVVRKVSVLVGEIEVAEGASAHDERNAEEVVHGRMVVGPRGIGEFLGEVVSDDVGVVRHLAEKPISHGGMADESVGHRIQTRIDELDRVSPEVEHREGAVAGSGQGRRGFDEGLERRVVV